MKKSKILDDAQKQILQSIKEDQHYMIILNKDISKMLKKKSKLSYDEKNMVKYIENEIYKIQERVKNNLSTYPELKQIIDDRN